ncbi:MAG TPA: hypothetical protein VIJ92_15630 [Ginsengibacter sp.]
MLLSIFSTLYETLAGENPNYAEYRESIFTSVGWLTLITVFIISLIFYVGFGRWKPFFHKLSHWIITLIIVAILGFLFAFMLSRSELGITDSYVIRFSFFNAIYAVIYFIIFSLLLKRVSIFAKRTPF